MCGLRASFFITLWAPVLCLAAASAWCAEVSQCQVLLWETALTVILWRMHLPHWISEHALGWKRWHSPVFLFFWAWKTVWLLLAEEYTAGPVARISDCETPITHRGHWQQRQVAKCLRAVSWSPVFFLPTARGMWASLLSVLLTISVGVEWVQPSNMYKTNRFCVGTNCLLLCRFLF